MENPDVGEVTLPADAVTLYEQIAHGERVSPEAPGLDILGNLGLILPVESRRGVFLAVDPIEAQRRRLLDEQRELLAKAADIARLPSVYAQVESAFERGHAISMHRASEYLPDASATNTRITELMRAGTKELITAQPGHRPPLTISDALWRDTDAVRRGLRMRTLYNTGARSNSPERAWVATMAELGVQVRTTPGPFRRGVIIDRRHAVVADLVHNRQGAAYHVSDPVSVAHILADFEAEWDRADRWIDSGAVHAGPSTAAVDDDGRVTTERERAILALLSEGHEQKQLPDQLGVSRRTVGLAIQSLKKKSGRPSVAALCYWWATHPENPRSQS
ncbi:LuxR C-terminal-related transcriptional regulator [Streptomyces sp. NPDC002073]